MVIGNLLFLYLLLAYGVGEWEEEKNLLNSSACKIIENEA
jgi:hypothetical protein